MFLMLALMAQLATGGSSYPEARALAAEHKSHLTTEQASLVQQKFTEAMRSAFPQCMVTVRPTESIEVSVVLSIGNDGNVVESWSKQDDAFGKCIEAVLASKTYIPAPSQPFYTAFDLNLGIKQSAP